MSVTDSLKRAATPAPAASRTPLMVSNKFGSFIRAGPGEYVNSHDLGSEIWSGRSNKTFARRHSTHRIISQAGNTKWQRGTLYGSSPACCGRIADMRIGNSISKCDSSAPSRRGDVTCFSLRRHRRFARVVGLLLWRRAAGTCCARTTASTISAIESGLGPTLR
jgi:hypothetical protein